MGKLRIDTTDDGEDRCVLGYRVKREEEKIGAPIDDVLVPYDPELQASFERIVFEVFGDNNPKLRS